MAGYPVFQPQEPHIDISLFGDAAQAGTNVGKAIPSAISSIVSGAEQGINFAQEYQAKEAQIKNEQAVAQINELKLKEAQDTETEQIQSTKSELIANTAKNNNAANIETQKADFYDELNNADPSQRAKIVLGNKYAQLFAADKNLYNQQLENIYFDGNNGIDQNVRGRIGQALKIGKESTYRDHIAAQNENKLIESTSDLYNEPLVAAAAEKLGTTPEQVPYKMELVEHNKYQKLNGNLVPDIEAGGGWKIDPKYNPEISKNSWDAIDPSTGTIIDDSGSVNDKTRDKLRIYKQNVATVGGQYKLRGIQQVTADDGAEKPSVSAQKVDVPTLQESSKSIKEKDITEQTNLTPADKIANDLAQSLKIDAKALRESARPTLEKLNSQITSYIKEPLARGNPSTLKEYNNTVQSLARHITDNQFENSEGLKTQYTDSQVANYNEELLGSFRQDLSGVGGGFSAMFNNETKNQVLNAFKVNSPEDLYYVKQSPVIESVINRYVNSRIVGSEKQKKTIPSAQKASNATVSFLSGVASGAPR